jgi:hypothetical protein
MAEIMAAASLDIFIEQGATFFRRLTIKDENDQPVDLTGRTFRGKIKRSIGGAELASFTFDILNQTTDPGKITMALTPTQTAALPVKRGTDAIRTTAEYIYDVEMVYGTGDVDRILQGKATVSGEATT